MYDMRTLRAPSMQMVTTVAEWGAHPVRQKRSSPYAIGVRLLSSGSYGMLQQLSQ